MSFDFSTLITDRSKADVDAALGVISRVTNDTATLEERQQLYDGLLKGMYDFTDFNRVTACMIFLKDRLASAGYLVTFTPVGPYGRSDYPTAAELERYRQGVEVFRAVLALDLNTPVTPVDIAGMYHWEANNIEEILLAVDRALDRIEKTIDLGWALGIAHTSLYGSV